MIGQEFVGLPGCWAGVAPEKLRDEVYDGRVESRFYSTSGFLGAHNGKIHSVIPCGATGDGVEIRVEILPESLADRWRRMGLRFATAAEVERMSFRELLVKAISLIGAVDPFGGTVGALCRSVHPLMAPDADTDVSYSDPELPLSAFVSVPPSARYAVERLAENVLHEALHLQLSLVERILPMVVNGPMLENVFSPWAGEGRTVRGLLHGVYVFGNLCCFWTRVAERIPNASEFARDRVAAIDAQLTQASHLLTCRELTAVGRRLASALLPFESAVAAPATLTPTTAATCTSTC